MIPDTIETKTSDFLPHSKLGITSCVIAVIVFVYFLVAGYVSLYVLDDFFKDSNVFAALGIVIIWFFIHLALCSFGFTIGLALAIVGVIKKDKKRLFPVIGLIFNLLPLISALIFTIYFFSLSEKQ